MSKKGQIEGGLRWEATAAERPRILVSGRMDRAALDAKVTAVTIPAELRARVELLLAGGGINGALVGLLHYALDEIERQKEELQVHLG